MSWTRRPFQALIAIIERATDGWAGWSEAGSGLLHWSPMGQLDTLIWLSGLDTETYGWRFSIHMFNEEESIGSPPPATTPRLTLTPDDNRLELNVLQGVPWQVNEYVFEREQSEGEGWTVLDTVDLPMFVDTGLVNGSTYCYRVTTIGSYDDPTTESPLLNRSQISCGRPFDYTPPCNVQLEVNAYCDLERDTLRWALSSDCTSDDVVGFRIYWAPFLGDSLQLWKEFNDVNVTSAVFNDEDSLGTIAGCFWVAAMDSLMPGPNGELRRNQSLGRDTVCGQLPFIFPMCFHPMRTMKRPVPTLSMEFVDSVHVVIHNRWGEAVFETNNLMSFGTGPILAPANDFRMGFGLYCCGIHETLENCP